MLMLNLKDSKMLDDQILCSDSESPSNSMKIIKLVSTLRLLLLLLLFFISAASGDFWPKTHRDHAPTPTQQGFSFDAPTPSPLANDGGGSSEFISISPTSPPPIDSAPVATPVPSPSAITSTTSPGNEDEYTPQESPAKPSTEHSAPTSRLPDQQDPEPDPNTIRWCALPSELVDCRRFLPQLQPTSDVSWECVEKETVEECLKSIKSNDADLITLEPGLAYIAFINYSMKAILNEVYKNRAEYYNAVAVVNKRSCDQVGGAIDLMSFKGKRSCHGGYSTSTGWNYPLNFLKSLENNKAETFSEFFSAVCAPSEIEGTGVCSACGNGTTTCAIGTMYSGHSGAFRCLVEGLGDIAFVRAETPLLYSSEGPFNQSWSSKSLADFMYLCPTGGCRAINGYPGECIFGNVPADVIMSANSISKSKKLALFQALLNSTNGWQDLVFAGKNGAASLFSSSAQGLEQVKQLTRPYLGISAAISADLLQLP